MKTITFTVAKTGQVAVRPEGYAGESCKAATRPYEAKLGLTESDVPTAELYQQEAQNQAEAQ